MSQSNLVIKCVCVCAMHCACVCACMNVCMCIRVHTSSGQDTHTTRCYHHESREHSRSNRPDESLKPQSSPSARQRAGQPPPPPPQINSQHPHPNTRYCKLHNSAGNQGIPTLLDSLTIIEWGHCQWAVTDWQITDQNNAVRAR
jgi:hypothetical protein